jgi:hypothetical protein
MLEFYPPFLVMRIKVLEVSAQWRKVRIDEVVSGDQAVLASTDGIAGIRHGQWVEDRRNLLAVVVQIFDDVNLSATGMVAIEAEGEVVVRAEGDLQIDNGSRSGLAISGIESAGILRIEAAGSIYAMASNAIQGSLLRAGGDITLSAEGGDGVQSFGALRTQTNAWYNVLPPLAGLAAASTSAMACASVPDWVTGTWPCNCSANIGAASPIR